MAVGCLHFPRAFFLSRKDSGNDFGERKKQYEHHSAACTSVASVPLVVWLTLFYSSSSMQFLACSNRKTRPTSCLYEVQIKTAFV